MQLESLRSRMYLLADVEVFTGSIRSNLLVGADEPSADALNSLLKELDLLHVILTCRKVWTRSWPETGHLSVRRT